GQEPGFVERESLNGSQITGLFDHNRVAVVQKRLPKKIQALLGTTCNEDTVDRHIQIRLLFVTRRYVLPESGMAFRAGILQNVSTLSLERLARCLFECLDREQRSVGQASREGSHRGIERNLEYLAYEGTGDVRDSVREDVIESCHVLHPPAERPGR